MGILDVRTIHVGMKVLLDRERWQGAEFTDPMTGETIDLSKARSSGQTKDLKHSLRLSRMKGAKGL